MRKLRVLVLMHENLVPPDTLEGYSDEEQLEWKTEFDVLHTLRHMGHDAQPLGVSDDLGKIRRLILDWKPQIAFNLLEEFHGVWLYDTHVVSFLELMRQMYTGCNPRGLMLAHDKVLTKQLLAYHRIPTPKFYVAPLQRQTRMPKRMKFPLLVKSATADASLGITAASRVNTPEELEVQIARIHAEVQTDALVEEYIGGRELYVGVLGNHRLQTFPAWELKFANAPDMPVIATADVKWNAEHQKQLGVTTGAAEDLPPGLEAKIARLSRRVYRALHLSGFARMDFRVSPEGKPYVLEANPNPNLSYGEDYAEAAHAAGIEYEELLQRLMNLGLRYRAAWRQDAPEE